jgi:iron uptake system component EfeO
VTLSTPTEPRRAWIIFGIAILTIAALITLAAIALPQRTSSAAVAAPSAQVLAVTAGIDDCGAGWADSHGGSLNFAVSNSTIVGEEVYLQSADTQAVYGEVEGLGTNAIRTLDVVLGDGRYRFVCIPAESDPIQGPVVTITDAPAQDALTPGIQIVTVGDLLPAAKAYQAWITSRLPVLAADAQALDAAVTSGDLTTARAAWLTTHLEYESLGAAYGAFGDADGAINGMPAAGLTALADPDLTGLHKIEALLWSNADQAAIAPLTAQLVTDVDALGSTFQAARVNALDVGLRSHEILENAIEFELTGTADAGSHTGLATIGANITGTREALQPLESILSTRYADLPTAEAWLDRSAALIASYQHSDGSWTALGDLTQAQRETLNSTLDQTVELLAPVAAICDPRTRLS